MKIIIAKNAGFCMGVRRAVEMVLDAPATHKGPICTYGPLIHNPQVLQTLEDKGIQSIGAIPARGSGTALIRAHGVPPETESALTAAGFDVVDATCPRVIKVQTIIRKHAEKGYAVIIVGDENHPEVIGLLGYAGRNGFVANTITGLEALPAFEKAIIVAQTTQNMAFYATIKQWAERRYPHYKVFDTICDSTAKRQAEIDTLAAMVDAIVVVGGKNSGNTLRLAEIARQSGKPTFHIETEDELDLSAIAEAETVGVTAGASTPNWIIQRVCRKLETAPMNSRSALKRILFGFVRALVLTNIYLSLGAGCLGYASSRMLHLSQSFSAVLVAMLYVQSMHVLNNLTGNKADRYNDPIRAAFYDRHRFWLYFLVIVAGGAGLLEAAHLGPLPFVALLALSITGLSYNIKLIPPSVDWFKYRRIKDIPGSKTVLITLAWAVVTVLLPALVNTDFGPAVWIVFFWAGLLVLARTAFFELLDIQGDRIVGQETLPILLGEARTLRLLRIVLIVCALLPAIGSAVGLFSPIGYAMATGPIFLAVIIAAFRRNAMLPGIRLEFLADTLFIVIGTVAAVFSLIGG